MIATLAALIALVPTHVIEISEPADDRVTIAAVFKLPPLDPLTRASADVMAQVVTNDNDSYTKQEMRDLCMAGGQPRCFAMADHMTIQLSVLPADIGAGMRMMAAMVSSARMQMDVMNQYLLTEPYRHKSVWTLGLDNEDRAWDRLRVTDISGLYFTVFRPDNVVLAAGGALKPGEAQAAWNDASTSWVKQHALPLRRSIPFKNYPQPYPSHVIELRGPEVKPDDPSLATKLLALMALGSGKSSSLFQDIREQRALSYRQEGVLWPTENGFVPRLVFQIKPMPPDQETKELADIKAALLDDVSKWTDATLQRAQGFGSVTATNGSDLSPLYFRPSSPLASSIEDRTLLTAYWDLKTGTPWNGDAMAAAFKAVDVQTLKSEATAIVKFGIPVLHPAPSAN